MPFYMWFATMLREKKSNIVEKKKKLTNDLKHSVQEVIKIIK